MNFDYKFGNTVIGLSSEVTEGYYTVWISDFPDNYKLVCGETKDYAEALFVYNDMISYLVEKYDESN